MYSNTQGRASENAEDDKMCHDWQELFQKGAPFEVFDAAFLEPPDRAYSIFDRFGGRPQEALNLRDGLTDQRSELLRFIHDMKEQESEDES